MGIGMNRTTWRRLFVVGAAASAALLGTTTPAAAQQRALGLDVSAWQGDLSQSSWNTIKNTDGRQFAFIRSSRGGTIGFYNQGDADNGSRLNTYSQRYDDPYFATNISRATTAGMLAGLYHFGRMDVTQYEMDGQATQLTGTDEANHMLQRAGPYMRPGYLLPIFDYEAGSGVQSHTELAQFGIDFSDRIYEVTGIRPGVYIGGNYAQPLNSLAIGPEIVAAYPVLWTPRWPNQADPDSIPVQTANPSDYTSTVYGPWDNSGNAQPWHFWQYASTGDLQGTPGNTDLNVAHGTIEYLKDHLVPALWMNDSSGQWSAIANWNSDNRDYNAADVTKGPAPRLPGVAASGANDTVMLDRPSANITVTHSSGTTNIRKLYVKETLNITGGSLTVNYDPTTTDARVGRRLRQSHRRGFRLLDTGASAPNLAAQFSAAVTLSGNASLSVHKLQVDATRTFTVAGGTLTFNTINLMPHASSPATVAITGNVTINPLNNFQNNATATIANGSGGGTSGRIDLGNATRTITVNDGTAATDLAVAVPIVGSGGGLTKAGAGTMSLTAASTFTGPLSVHQGSVVLSGNGSAAAASGYTVRGGATLQLDNTTTNSSNRLATALVHLQSGSLSFIGNTTSEIAGDLSAANGASTVAMSGNGTNTLVFGSFTRFFGATVNFTGADVNHRATFSSGVTAGDFIDQGTFVNGADYAVYNSGTNYVRAMTTGAGASDYATSISLDRHVKLSATASGVAGTTIKTLNLAGATVGLDLAPSSTLTLSSGGVIKSGGGVSSISGSGSSLFAPVDVEYVFNTAGASDELVVDVAIGGGADFTKTGAGTLTLTSAANNYSGRTTVAQGTLKLGAADVIPDDSDVIVAAGATLNMNSFSETIGNLTMFDGTISSAGTLTLSGSFPLVSYLGVGSGATISTTNLSLGGGSAGFSVADGAAAMDLTINSVIQNGSLTKTGAGTLHLSGTNSFTGPLDIVAGTLSVSSINATAAADQPLGNSSAAITLGSSESAALQYTGGSAATLNRQLTVAGAAGATIRATAGALTLGSDVAGNGNPVSFDTAGGNITVGGVISGGGTTVTKTGASILTLSGSNTYTGNTIVKEGILAYGSSANLGDSTNAIVFDGGTLRTLASGTQTRNITLNAAGGTIDSNGFTSNFSGVISGAGGLTKIGTGTLVLSGVNTYSGTTVVSAGILSLTGSTHASSKVEVVSGGTLSGNGSVLGNASVIGTGIVNFSAGGNIAGTLTTHGGSWNGSGSVTGAVSIPGGTFSVGSGANLTAAGGVNVTGGTLGGAGTVTGNVSLLNSSLNTSTIQFGSTGNITGTLNVTGGVWAGTGSVGGMTTVTSGALFVNGTMGGAGGLTLASGADLHGLGTINKTLTLSGNNHLGGWTHLHSAGSGSPSLGQLTIGAPVVWGAPNLFITGGPVSTTGDTISGNLTIESPFDIQHGYDLNYLVELRGTGTAAITTSGSLLGNGRVTKPVTITGNGIINLSAPPALPTGGSTLSSTLTATGGFWNGQGSVTGAASVSSGTFTIGPGANLTANGNLTVFASGQIAGTGTITGSVTYTSVAATTFPGVIAGAGKFLSVSSTSGGSLTLSGNNSFTGALSINAGTLVVTSINATPTANQPLGNSAAAISFGTASANGTLHYSGAAAATLNRSLNIAGAGGGTVRASAGTLTLASAITGNGNPVTFDAAGANINVTGVISGTGTSVTKTGTGILTLGGNNTYTGNTTVNNGVLAYTNSANLGSSAAIVLSGGTLRTLAGGTEIRNVTLNAGGGTIDSNGFDSTFSGLISGVGGLTKIGSGVLTLTGTNTYAGNTTINAGVLEYSTSAISARLRTPSSSAAERCACCLPERRRARLRSAPRVAQSTPTALTPRSAAT